YLFLTQDQTVVADWIIWFLADALGMIAFAPFLLSIQRHEASTLLQAQRTREMLLTVLIATVVTACVFWQSRYPILFLILPVIMLPAFRLGFTATALTSMLVSIIAAVLTILGHGPFTLIIGADLQERALILQTFVATTNLMALPAAAALADRRRVIALLDAANHFQQALLNNAAHAIIATDRNGLITLFNSGAERMLGYQAAELVGLHTPEVIHLPQEVASQSAALAEMLKQPIEPGFPSLVAIARANADQHECTFRRKDGS